MAYATSALARRFPPRGAHFRLSTISSSFSSREGLSCSQIHTACSERSRPHFIALLTFHISDSAYSERVPILLYSSFKPFTDPRVAFRVWTRVAHSIFVARLIWIDCIIRARSSLGPRLSWYRPILLFLADELAEDLLLCSLTEIC